MCLLKYVILNNLFFQDSHDFRPFFEEEFLLLVFSRSTGVECVSVIKRKQDLFTMLSSSILQQFRV